jgi:tetratricopeptide (TPR) repeat protein
MKLRILWGLLLAGMLTVASHAEPGLPGDGEQAASILAPTNHPVLPRDLSRLWLVPAKPGSGSASGAGDFLAAMKVADKVDYAKALPLMAKAADAESPFGNYAMYYAGLAELRLGRFAQARSRFQQLLARRPIGYLAEAAALGEAECAEGLNDYDGAVEIYERLAAVKTAAPDELLMRLGGAAKSAGDNRKAAEAFGRVLYDFPFSRFDDFGVLN